jgi:hypothetical protein
MPVGEQNLPHLIFFCFLHMAERDSRGGREKDRDSGSRDHDRDHDRGRDRDKDRDRRDRDRGRERDRDQNRDRGSSGDHQHRGREGDRDRDRGRDDYRRRDSYGDRGGRRDSGYQSREYQNSRKRPHEDSARADTTSSPRTLWNFEAPWNVTHTPSQAPLPLATPLMEYLRAKEVLVLRSRYDRECRELLGIDPPKDSLNRWLFEMLTVPASEDNPDPLLKSPALAVQSVVLARELNREYPVQVSIFILYRVIIKNDSK